MADADAGRTGQPALLALLTEAERLKAAAQPERVIALYRDWLRHADSPLAYAIHFNLAVTLADAGDTAGAEAAYRQAIRQRADFIPARLNLGTLYENLGRPEEALAQWAAVLELDAAALARERPLHLQALNNSGRLLEVRRRFAEAERMLQRSLDLAPDQPKALQHWIHLRQKQCKWPVYDALPGISPERMVEASSALSTLSLFDDPARQLAAAHRLIAERVTPGLPALAGAAGYAHAKLRIGYLSSDFCLHPVALLTAELFELHDRERFEIYAFCSSPEDGSALRQRVLRAMDRHLHIADMDDAAAARAIRACEIDILVDLQGLTAGVRPGIFAHRPAPVQLSWLGYPGTTAHPAIDGVIGDAFVFPEGSEAFLTERPIRLPTCFQPGDRRRETGAPPTRSAHGLPDDAFVYCSFNNNYKFTPEIFAAWMRILHRVPDSVLWLLADNPWAAENLRREAEQRGIGRQRLIFAARVAPPDYLARYRLADLFLDTYPFNAGTTANDALWMGLPLLTRSGRTFASRMAGSLLHAAGLPELVTTGAADYEDKAVELGRDRKKTAALRQRLEQARATSRLFDMARFTRELEASYAQLAGKETPPMTSTASAPEQTPDRTFLHVGCGPRRQADTLPAFNAGGWREIRLDIDAAVSPDVLGSMTDMSAVADASMDAVFSSHNLEHLYPHEVPAALREFLRVLKPDGVAIVTCPDLQSVCALIAANKLTETAYHSSAGPITPLDILYGHRAAIESGNTFMAHRCGFTRDSLSAELLAAGFATAGALARPENLDLWAVASKSPVSQEQFAKLVEEMLG